jgi:hypothetical protein
MYQESPYESDEESHEPEQNDQGYMIQRIKQWFAIENKLTELSSQMKELRKMRKELNVDLLEIMKTHNIDCFDCNSGKIMYTRNNVKKTINKKYLNEILQKYYGNDNSQEAQELCEFILDNREIQVKENIKFKKNR